MLIKNEAKTTKQKKKFTKFKLSFTKLFKKNKKKMVNCEVLNYDVCFYMQCLREVKTFLGHCQWKNFSFQKKKKNKNFLFIGRQ